MFKFVKINKHKIGYSFTLEPLMAPGFSVRVIDGALEVGESMKGLMIIGDEASNEV
jgi:hypothetical protein